MLLLCSLAALASSMPSNTLYLGDASRGPRAQQVLRAHRAHLRADMAAISRMHDVLLSHHAISQRMALPRFDTFIMDGAPGSVPLAPRRKRDGATPLLTFAYQGWNANQRTSLSTLLAVAYNQMVNVYGPPMTSGTLTIIQGGEQDALQGGELDITNPAQMTLTVGPLTGDFSTDDNDPYIYDLLHLILHAFHAPALIGYDAWEDGMARAAAAVIITSLRPNYSLMNNLTYLLPLYDYLNQPGLATSAFFPAQDIPLMSTWRVGMAMAAWLKMYTEYPYFFQQFNTAYAAQVLGGNTALAGNLAALKTLLAGFAPTVEGIPFARWYNCQYVLQSTALVGQRLFMFPTPLQDNIILQIYYFFTNADGTENPLSGQANLVYLTDNQVALYPAEGNQVTISATGQSPGLGIITPSFYHIGETATQCISIQVTVADQSLTTYFPYMERGENEGDENTFFGCTLGANDGTLNISYAGNTLSPTTIVQGAFAQSIPFNGANNDLSFFTAVQFSYTSSDGSSTVILQRDVGPGFYSALLPVADNTAVTLTTTFLNGVQMVSFPLTPTANTLGKIDAATVLGLPARSLQLAWWNPTQQKYLYYPDSAIPSIAPGQAYWLKLPSSQMVTISGTQLPRDDPRGIVLQPGWNLVGNTYNAALYQWDMSVATSSGNYTLLDALTEGYVGPVWCYNANGAYEINNTLAAWEGGWMVNNTTQPITLFQTNASRMQADRNTLTRSVNQGLALFSSGGWAVPLRACTSSAQDNVAYLGVNVNARSGVNGLDWLKPPPATANGVRLAFINPARSAAGPLYASDIRPCINPKGEIWECIVTSTKNDQVTLSWPDLSFVPSQYQLRLEDEASNTCLNMYASQNYRYQAKGSTAQPDVRHFRVIITARKSVLAPHAR